MTVFDQKKARNISVIRGKVPPSRKIKKIQKDKPSPTFEELMEIARFERPQLTGIAD